MTAADRPSARPAWLAVRRPGRGRPRRSTSWPRPGSSANIAPGQVVDVVGTWVRLIFSRNDGALFGLFGSSATLFAIGSLAVLGLIIWYHARSPRSLLLSVALGLLLGGALGNLIDRLRLGYVVDFVDMGIGTLRFFTFNVGDSAISRRSCCS